MATFLVIKYRKQPQKILPALIVATERVQLVIAQNTLDIFNARTGEWMPPEKL